MGLQQLHGEQSEEAESWGRTLSCWKTPSSPAKSPSQIETESLCAEAATLRLFSIGTNDLTEFTPAVDRTNREVAHRADPFDPAVLRLIAETATAAVAQGRWVGVCGR